MQVGGWYIYIEAMVVLVNNGVPKFADLGEGKFHKWTTSANRPEHRLYTSLNRWLSTDESGAGKTV